MIEEAKVLNCKVRSVPFLYLGLPVGANPRNTSTWDPVIDKESDGLGIKNIITFYVALLGKWVWRLRVEQENLWYDILKFEYGEKDWRIKTRGKNSSRWLKELKEEEKTGVGSNHNWFTDNVSKVLGGEAETCFDCWV
ncbi:unnamed protein product [Vicia faba]|uniref:Uncharacterized protein n=1 Tax=Vicia faba TaxID=3906 RepID=A0AAV1A7R8_VICFA|nr:unnamed protein product [Vicia faba]